MRESCDFTLYSKKGHDKRIQRAVIKEILEKANAKMIRVSQNRIILQSLRNLNGEKSAAMRSAVR